MANLVAFTQFQHLIPLPRIDCATASWILAEHLIANENDRNSIDESIADVLADIASLDQMEQNIRSFRPLRKYKEKEFENLTVQSPDSDISLRYRPSDRDSLLDGAEGVVQASNYSNITEKGDHQGDYSYLIGSAPMHISIRDIRGQFRSFEQRVLAEEGQDGRPLGTYDNGRLVPHKEKWKVMSKLMMTLDEKCQDEDQAQRALN